MFRVSFDFDDCLSNSEYIQEYCAELVADPKIEVWIVTSRPRNPDEFFNRSENPTDNPWQNEDDLFPLADRLGVPRERIVFTEWEWKSTWFKTCNLEFRWHLDDNSKEIRELAGIEGGPTPISCTQPNWINKCNRLLLK